EEPDRYPAHGRSEAVAGGGAVGGEAEDGAEDRLVVEAGDSAEVPRVGKLRFLMTFAQGRTGGEPVGVESSHAVELVSQSLDQLAEDADSRLAPGGGDEDLIEIGPIDAVE